MFKCFTSICSLAGGALLIMTAMCCWLKAPNRTGDASDEVITTKSPIIVSLRAFMSQQLSSEDAMGEEIAFNDSIN